MAVGKITKRSVDAMPVPASGKRTHLWDDTLKGFGVMAMPPSIRNAKGNKTYLVQYRMGGRETPTQRYKIGRHGSPWTAEEARERAREVIGMIDRNIDPLSTEREDRERVKSDAAQSERERLIRERLAFSAFADRFVEEYAKSKQPRTWKDTKQVINNDLKPEFKDRPLTEIDDADISELLQRLKNRAGSASKRGYVALSLIYKHACNVERRYIKKADNPMTEVDPPWKATNRERYLSKDELVLVWRASFSLEWPFGPAIRLLILTGQRLNEVGEMPWHELRLEKHEWVIPGARTKNKLDQLVPLSGPVLDILKSLPKIHSEGDWLFSTNGGSPVSGWANAKRSIDRAILNIMRDDAGKAGQSEEEIEKLKIKPWRFHDLRRSLTTGCQGLGVPIEHTEAVLNHITYSKSGLKGVYHLYEYASEKANALDAWAEHVLDAVDADDRARKRRVGR